MAIAPIGTASAQLVRFDQALPNIQATAETNAPQTSSFGDMLTNAVQHVNADQVAAREAVAGLASGENVDLHGTMIRLEKAEITLRAMTSVRDRMITAYEQIMNMAL